MRASWAGSREGGHDGAIAEDVAGELDDGASGAGTASGSSFSFASAATSQLIMDRIMSQSVRFLLLAAGPFLYPKIRSF